LDTAKEEIRVLTDDRDRLTKEVASLREEQDEQQKEHARVVAKFGKLREALTAEKQKVEESESRACKAEALAGKGSFNTEETRVLHLQRNPLTEAMRERYESEIRGLQRQLEETTGQKPARGAAASGSEVDPQKLHQRLKQSFKEQIALFREGVYLMTGYKVDMLPGAENPKFRVRSVYAEQEQDHLMFVCKKDGEEITSLDLVGTDLANLLSQTDSYEYMTKFNSLPAFLASVQLNLFEKTTLIASSSMGE
jgi:mitotic spindle assembly checkpoint protein MAD1